MWFALWMMACGTPEPEGCALKQDVVADCGVAVDGAEIRIGDDRSALVEALGEPESTAHFGNLGERLAYPDLGLTATVSVLGGVSALTVSGDFSGTVDCAISLGATQEAVQAALGDARRDPVTGTWFYEGLAVVWTDGQASSLQVD